MVAQMAALKIKSHDVNTMSLLVLNERSYVSIESCNNRYSAKVMDRSPNVNDQLSKDLLRSRFESKR